MLKNDFTNKIVNGMLVKGRDEVKRKYCEDNNINYLVIRYDENIEEVLIKNNII